MPVEIQQLDVVPAPTPEVERAPQMPATPPTPATPGPVQTHDLAATIAVMRARQLRLHAD